MTDSAHALFPYNDPHMRITGHRARVLAMFFLCMAWMGGSGRLGILLDRLFFPRALRTEVKAPVFIIGNFRSGSTLLHRLLAADPQFTAMKTWEIYFAPSVTQRKFWRGFWMVDRLFGAPIMRRIRRAEASTFSEVQMHRIKLAEPEEDEALLMYVWDSVFNWFFMPYRADENPYWRFDTALPRWRRRKAMAFYHSCLRRHMFVHGRPVGGSRRGAGAVGPEGVSPVSRAPERPAAQASAATADRTATARFAAPTYVSKNPSFSAKLSSLLDEFPDARIVYLVRHPADTLVSTIGWFSFAWSYFSSPAEEYPMRETIMELTRQWYLKPLAILERLPPERYRIVRYEELVAHPQKTVTGLLEHFGFTPGVETCRQLDDLENGPPVHKSHSIELGHVGLDPARVAEFYAEVFERFGYQE